VFARPTRATARSTCRAASRTDLPDQQIPRINIEAEHYGRIARSVQLGQPVVVEADIENEWYDNPDMFNVVGEIRGTELPNEVVIIGGHFDSWHAATGATDNGGACSIALEAMRLLKANKTYRSNAPSVSACGMAKNKA
jgi:carboxypeptidase Q